MEAKHSYSQAEKRGYVDFINQDMCADPDLESVFPIDTQSDQIFEVIADGILLNKMINKTFPDVVDEKQLCKKAKKSAFEININHDHAIEGAKTIGCSIVNIGATDLSNKVPHLVMGMLWQIIKRCLMAQIERNMDISRLAGADEAIDKVPPEQILLRWFNYHLKRAGHHRIVTNFSDDIKDGENYAVLLSQIAPDTISSDDLEQMFRAKAGLDRAEVVLHHADRLGCKAFVAPQDIVDGNPRLNLAFVATLFKEYPSLGPTAEEIAEAKAQDLESQLAEVESMLKDANVEKDSLQASLDQTKMDFDALTDELSSLTLDLENVTNEKESLFNEKCDLEKLLENMTVEKENVEDQLQKTTAEKDDLFSQLQQEISLKLDLETELNDTKDEFANFRAETQAEISSLTEQLEHEMALKTEFSTRLEETITELEKVRAEASDREADLLSQLKTETDAKNALAAELQATKDELADTQRLAEEAERTKDDLFKLLTDTISELETTKATASERERELEERLAAETAAKEDYMSKLKQLEEEYARAKADWEEEREKLLARIRELEEELAKLKEEMRSELERMEKEKQDALELAEAEKRRALNDAANEKDMALDKVRLLLKGNQKQGYLLFETEGFLGKEWKKRFFVLKDNLLSWYKSDAKSGTKPIGVVYCEEARLYEVSKEECGRENAFQMDTGKVRYNVAAESLEEMKEWMTEIRVAKKKKLGVKVVSEEKNPSRS